MEDSSFTRKEICKIKSVIEYLCLNGEVNMQLVGESNPRKYCIRPGTYNLHIKGMSLIGPILLPVETSLSTLMQYIVEEMPEDEIIRIR